MRKVAVISGGGSHGAELAGYLITKQPEYDTYICTSTGSLIGVLLACRKFAEMEEGYTTITDREMYGILKPFKDDGSINKVRLSLAVLNMLRRLNLNAYDISKPLKARVKKYFKVEDFRQLKKKGIEVIVTAQCIDHIGEEVEYYSNLSEGMTYELFVDCVVASASIPFAAKPVSLLGEKHVDGGVGDPIPAALLFDNYKNDQIDVYLNSSKHDFLQRLSPINGLFEYLARLVQIMRTSITKDDLDKIYNLAAFNRVQGNDMNIRIYWSEYKELSLAHFSPEVMKRWLEIGKSKKDIILQRI